MARDLSSKLIPLILLNPSILMRVSAILKLCCESFLSPAILLFLINEVETMFMKMFRNVKRILHGSLLLLARLHCLSCRILRFSKMCPKIREQEQMQLQMQEQILETEVL